MRLQRGLTLVELIVALVGMVFIFAALGGSYAAAMSWQERSVAADSRLDDDGRLEKQLTALIQDAYLIPLADDQTSYLIGTNSQGVGETSDTLTFTRLGPPPASRYLNSDEEDFALLNESYGVQGGLEEVSLSLTPVGSEASSEGLFLRKQRPSDGDATQGGREMLLDEGITALYFEFFDGEQWQTTWDTVTTGPRRLPAAVRITYSLADQTDSRSLVVRLVNSDATPEDPAVQEVQIAQ